ncbi:hypothetical protein RJ640_016911 [Escallonia rubra]|uniref:BHLH domain-containing protein n=1 Tax=Escallonia rubra TaxID=112253 RepID=A0AA88R373_9ASTE|nr:hypothetical protein RJ640_016911 [Escallonia rubra]
MDQQKMSKYIPQPVSAKFVSNRPPPRPLCNSNSKSRQRTEVEAKDAVAARKVQKADREKLRRDKLNEQFIELGNALARQIIQYADPDRPKNDKATILIDTIQILVDLTAEVNRLKAECAALSEESSELTQEKNELREEKASLRADIDTLNVQYQQRLMVMFPWAPFDPSIVTAQPYSYPVPLPVPPGPIAMHPCPPFPFIGNQNPGFIPNPCSTYIPYPTPANAHSDQLSTLQTSSSRISSKHECRSKLSDREKCSNDGKGDDFIDVVTELELKTPGSTVQQVNWSLISTCYGSTMLKMKIRKCELYYAGTNRR